MTTDKDCRFMPLGSKLVCFEGHTWEYMGSSPTGIRDTDRIGRIEAFKFKRIDTGEVYEVVMLDDLLDKFINLDEALSINNDLTASYSEFKIVFDQLNDHQKRFVLKMMKDASDPESKEESLVRLKRVLNLMENEQ